jgi:hypothetical protein
MKLESVKKIAGTSLKILLLLLVLSLGVLIFFKYFYTYSKGSNNGLLQKFTYVGNVFKTYEGEMILVRPAGSPDMTLASEKFFFSVTDDSLAQMLDTLQGKFITVHYKQKHGKLPWKGDTPYFVYDVKLKE